MGIPQYSSMALASIFSFFMPVFMVVNPNCDYYQNLIMGHEYYLYNQEFPSKYPPSTACRWVGRSEPGTRIIITCNDIRLPSSPSCNTDRLYISLSGNEDFYGGRIYCGTGTVTLVTDDNSVAVGLFAAGNSTGGRFYCTLTGIEGPSGPGTENPPDACDCGWKKETRIVGGVESGVNEYPAIVGIVSTVKRRLYCGGTIISKQYIVTAAHCIAGKDASSIGVLIGHDISKGIDTSSSSFYQVQAYETHPYFNSTTLLNDIALIKTKNLIEFSIRVGPTCLPFRYSSIDFSGDIVTALGWGQLEYSGPMADTLQKVNLTVIPNYECSTYQKKGIATSQMCTYRERKDACQSDSGGPLFWMDPRIRRLQLIGIISYGIGCATTTPGINTRTTSYLSWIASRTSDTTYCIK